MTERASQGNRPYSVPAVPDDSGDDAINLKVTHWGSVNSTPLQYSMVLSWIPDPRQIGDGDGSGPPIPEMPPVPGQAPNTARQRPGQPGPKLMPPGRPSTVTAESRPAADGLRSCDRRAGLFKS